MTRPGPRTGDAERFPGEVLAEVRRVILGMKGVDDEVQRVAARTRQALDEWERQTHPTATNVKQVRALIEHFDGYESKFGRRGDDIDPGGIRHTARRRAVIALNDIRQQGLVDSGAFDRALKIVDVLFTPNTIYSSIAPDDGGVTFYWRAADMSIEIDVYSGEGYWWRVRNVAAENYSGHGSDLPTDNLKYSLTWLSKEVDRANPLWRQQAI